MRLVLSLILAGCFSTAFAARQQTEPVTLKSSPVITAAAGSEKLRFVSSANVCQIRVQILSEDGNSLLDSAWKDGNVFDWPMEGALANGSYRCVVMVRDLDGQVTQREATLLAQGGQISIEQRAGTDAMTIVGRDESGPKITLLAHDGSNGSVVSTSGDLSFRFGNFLAAKDTEKMRLTADGELRVNGLIRANGIVFPDGTTLTTTSAGSSGSGTNTRQQPAETIVGRTVDLGSPAHPLVPDVKKPKPLFAPAYQFQVGDSGVTIGVTNPAYNLNVSGTINTNSAYQIGSNTVLNAVDAAGSTFVGAGAGISRTTGDHDTFVGWHSGLSTNTGLRDSFFGYFAGTNNTSGSFNSFFGDGAGEHCTTEDQNSAFGYLADITAGNTNATAIGAHALTAQSNTVILGSISGVNGAAATASTGIATQTPNQYLGVAGGITVDENNTNSGALNTNSVLAFGANVSGGGVSGEAIASQRTTGPRQYAMDFYTSYARRMTIYNSGDVEVVGTLFKGGGSFKIDHPLDPENKYLYHSFVESPDMKNIYDGVVSIDDRGEAVVQLPDWFEALNQDFRYQLTCLHGFAPVYVDEEISGNRFKIAGGKPGMRVSWQVTGTRHDAYANAHRSPVEEEKPAGERGTYLHPAEHDQAIRR